MNNFGEEILTQEYIEYNNVFINKDLWGMYSCNAYVISSNCDPVYNISSIYTFITCYIHPHILGSTSNIKLRIFKKNVTMGWEIIANKGLLLIKIACTKKLTTDDGISLPLKVSFHTIFQIASCSAESIGWFIEDQAFSASFDFAPTPPPPPSRQ
jgi:hypothetical protein